MDRIQVAIDVFNKRAEQYQEKFMDTSIYHDAFDIFCDHLPRKQADILELACGPGNVTKYLLDKHPDLHILATDLAANMLELAKASNPTAEVQLLDCRDISTLNRKFDGIMCAFALPYMSKDQSIQLIADAAVTLEDGGVFYISTMEDDYSKSGIYTSAYGDQVYMYYHEEDYLVKALEENGFSVVALQRKAYVYNGANTTDLIIIAKR